MANMGKYCKAYPVERFREFSSWTESLENLRTDDIQGTGEPKTDTTALNDRSFFYLQENYKVTDGIFIDENIIFDRVTPEWIDFCENRLKFQVPNYNTGTDAEAIA